MLTIPICINPNYKTKGAFHLVTQVDTINRQHHSVFIFCRYLLNAKEDRTGFVSTCVTLNKKHLKKCPKL